MRLKIVHIITGLEDGGAEGALYRLCLALKDVDAYVVSLGGKGKYGKLLEDAGIKTLYLYMPKGKVRFGSILRLWWFLLRIKPDAVQTWMYHSDLIGGITARLAFVKKVFWGVRHTDLIPGKSSNKTIVISRISASLSRYIPSGIVFCAEEAMKVHKELGYRSRKMVVIPNGFDVEILKPDVNIGLGWRSSHGLSIEKLVIGLVGRYNAQKDHQNLFEAIRLLSDRGLDFECVLVGDGVDEENKELINDIDYLGIRGSISLVGQQSDINSVMNGLDLFVLPSSFGEAFPNVLAEAMLCGVPCVSTDTGDSSEIIGMTGWVVPPSAPKELADAIQEAINEKNFSPSLWETRRKSARLRIVNLYSIDKMVNSYISLWAQE